MNKILVGWWHVYLTENESTWLSIVMEQVSSILSSKLHENLEELNISIIYRRELDVSLFMNLIEKAFPNLYNQGKVGFFPVKNPTSTDVEMILDLNSGKVISENYTLNLIHNACKKSYDSGVNVCYFHTKGITSELRHFSFGNNADYLKTYFWRKMLNYGVLEKWKDCNHLLDDFDVSGINFRTKPIPHYSGNFWWARASYIANLPSPESVDWWRDIQKKTEDGWLKSAPDRFRDEMWICSSNTVPRYGNLFVPFTENPAETIITPDKYYKEENNE